MSDYQPLHPYRPAIEALPEGAAMTRISGNAAAAVHLAAARDAAERNRQSFLLVEQHPAA